jgi:hypothetical protein
MALTGRSRRSAATSRFAPHALPIRYRGGWKEPTMTLSDGFALLVVWIGLLLACMLVYLL